MMPMSTNDLAGSPPTAPAPAREAAPLRRCIVGGHSAPPEQMLRFVVGPDDMVVPDIGRRLPGRGMWTEATRAVVEAAAARNQFSRAARRAVRSAPDMPERIEQMLHQRALDLVGLARRAGRAVSGMAKVEESVRRGRAGLVLVATDAGSDGRRHLGSVPQLLFADSTALGGVFGRDQAVYVAIEDDPASPGFASRIAGAVARWERYRGAAMPRTSN